MLTNFKSTSHPQVNLDGLKSNEAAVVSEFAITGPFFGHDSAVFEGTLSILSLILLARSVNPTCGEELLKYMVNTLASVLSRDSEIAISRYRQ